MVFAWKAVFALTLLCCIALVLEALDCGENGSLTTVRRTTNKKRKHKWNSSSRKLDEWCRCVEGYTGERCETRHCDHGKLNSTDCLCHRGYLGISCSEKYCVNGNLTSPKDPAAQLLDPYSWNETDLVCVCIPLHTGKRCNRLNELGEKMMLLSMALFSLCGCCFCCCVPLAIIAFFCHKRFTGLQPEQHGPSGSSSQQYQMGAVQSQSTAAPPAFSYEQQKSTTTEEPKTYTWRD